MGDLRAMEVILEHWGHRLGESLCMFTRGVMAINHTISPDDVPTYLEVGERFDGEVKVWNLVEQL